MPIPIESFQLEMAWRNLTLIWFSTTETVISDVDRESMAAHEYRAATLRWLEDAAFGADRRILILEEVSEFS